MRRHGRLYRSALVAQPTDVGFACRAPVQEVRWALWFPARRSDPGTQSHDGFAADADKAGRGAKPLHPTAAALPNGLQHPDFWAGKDSHARLSRFIWHSPLPRWR